MAKRRDPDDIEGQWTFVTPIAGVVLTDITKQEFVIKRVTLISQAKLPRVYRRLGFGTVSQSDSQSLALAQQRNRGEDPGRYLPPRWSRIDPLPAQPDGYGSR